MAAPDRIPVFFLSGFLGAGKSTLLNELLTDPAFHDSAVVINEFGDVPIDHLLVRRGETTISQVATGCLCCTGTTDLRTTLYDLHRAASDGVTAGFSRVIVELSGLGDPAPLVNALASGANSQDTPRDRAIDHNFFLAGIVTLYDIVTGAIAVERHFEALKQLAFADRIVLTKTDLAKDPATRTDIAALPDALQTINASAEIIDRLDVDLPALFSPRAYAAVDQGEDVVGWLALEAALAAETSNVHAADKSDAPFRHDTRIRTFSIVEDKPVPENKLGAFLALLQESAGPRLLRAKGIVATEADPERPLIIHAVQHVLDEPVRLDAWPDDDHRTRLVFITNGVDPKPVRDLFEAVISQKPAPTGRPMRRLGALAVAKITKAFTPPAIQSKRSR